MKKKIKDEKEKSFKDAGIWTWEENGIKVVRSVARTGPGCHEGCGVLLYVKDDGDSSTHGSSAGNQRRRLDIYRKQTWKVQAKGQAD